VEPYPLPAVSELVLPPVEEPVIEPPKLVLNTIEDYLGHMECVKVATLCERLSNDSGSGEFSDKMDLSFEQRLWFQTALKQTALGLDPASVGLSMSSGVDRLTKWNQKEGQNMRVLYLHGPAGKFPAVVFFLVYISKDNKLTHKLSENSRWLGACCSQS
jgi:hypothetical protein